MNSEQEFPVNEKDERREEYHRRKKEENRHGVDDVDPFEPKNPILEEEEWDGNWEDEWYEEEHLFDDYTPIWEQDFDPDELEN